MSKISMGDSVTLFTMQVQGQMAAALGHYCFVNNVEPTERQWAMLKKGADISMRDLSYFFLELGYWPQLSLTPRAESATEEANEK